MPLFRRILSKKTKIAEGEIECYLAVDDNSNRFYVAKKDDFELYSINEQTQELKIIPNSPESNLRLVGECTEEENKIANEIIQKNKEAKLSHTRKIAQNIKTKIQKRVAKRLKMRKKAVGEDVVYTAISPLFTKVQSLGGVEYEDELARDEINQFADDIKAAIGGEDLAPYLDDRYPELNAKVKSIKPGVGPHNGKLMALTRVYCSGGLGPKEIKQLKDYLTGQYSDGFGEGFEQREVATWTEEYDYSYEEEDEDGNVSMVEETDEVKVGLFISFWNSQGFRMEVVPQVFE
jgi:predicted metal-binding protein